jgi:hypothetical protein
MRVLDVVVLTKDIPQHGLRAGDFGTIVEAYPGGHGFEVEFVAPTGRTRAVLTLDRRMLRASRDSDVMTQRTA